MSLESHPDQPEWLSHVNASVLKVKLATAIIGISSIHLLKTFINAAAPTETGDHRADRRSTSRSCCRRSPSPPRTASCRRRRARTALPMRPRSNDASPTQEDFIQSVADALQYISLLPPRRLHPRARPAYEREQSPAAKDAIAQILTNSRMCAEGHRPICQDTGIVNVFVKVGMDVRWDATMSLEEMVNEGVRRAYTDPDNKLRASMLAESDFEPQEHARQHARRHPRASSCPATRSTIDVAAKGGGSENKSKFAMLQPVATRSSTGCSKTVPTDGRRLVPAGHARHRHRRHRREGDAAGEGSADGADRHGRAQGARPEDARSRSCASSSTTR